jgi:single-stranded DNA-binding protein
VSIMAVNVIVASGKVKSPALRYATDGKPELRFTLDQQDGEFHLWLPCCASGSAAERLASELEDGQHVVITSGKLVYRKRSTKLGEQSRLEVLVWQVDRLAESPQVERTDEGEQEKPGGEPANAPGGERPLPQKWTRGYVGVRSALQEA